MRGTGRKQSLPTNSADNIVAKHASNQTTYGSCVKLIQVGRIGGIVRVGHAAVQISSYRRRHRGQPEDYARGNPGIAITHERRYLAIMIAIFEWLSSLHGIASWQVEGVFFN